MAQRTGAERFLAPFVKSASARVALALALAALFACGCGGGSSDPQSSSTAAQAQATGQGSGAAQSGASASTQAEDKAASESQAGSADAGGPSAPSGQGAKHGKRIAQPTGPREQAPTPNQVAAATVADMTLESPAIAATAAGPGAIPLTYTCDGEDSWPALHWSGVPAGSAELAVFVMNVQPVQEKLFVDWAVARIDPSLEGLEAGQLPRGAVVGTNGFGKAAYSLCPPAGSGETYMFAVYALPTSLSPRKGFDARELRGQILEASGNAGLMAASYVRG